LERYVRSFTQNGSSSEIESGWNHDHELLHLVDKGLFADRRLNPWQRFGHQLKDDVIGH
jgi:hypothetical protein